MLDCRGFVIATYCQLLVGENPEGDLDFFSEHMSENNFQIIEPEYATDVDLLLVHSEEYINFVVSFIKLQLRD